MTTSTNPPILTRTSRPSDRQPLHELIASTGVFSSEEIAIARELIDSGLGLSGKDDGYKLLIAVLPSDDPAGERIVGYVCYGQTPFTRSSWDLYWLATHPDQQRRGTGRILCAAMEADIRSAGGTHIRVETSGTEGYRAARLFYERVGYQQMARLPDFYKPGDDLYTFLRRL